MLEHPVNSKRQIIDDIEKATARSGSRLILLLPKFGRQTGSEELDPAAVSYFESLFHFKCSSRPDTLTSFISPACSHSTTGKFGRGLKRDRDLKSGEQVASSV